MKNKKIGKIKVKYTMLYLTIFENKKIIFQKRKNKLINWGVVKNIFIRLQNVEYIWKKKNKKDFSKFWHFLEILNSDFFTENSFTKYCVM